MTEGMFWLGVLLVSAFVLVIYLWGRLWRE